MLCCLELYRLPVDTHESTTLFVLAYLVFGARSWLVKLCKVLLAAWVDWHLAVSLLTVDCVKHHSIPFDEGRVILQLVVLLGQLFDNGAQPSHDDQRGMRKVLETGLNCQYSYRCKWTRGNEPNQSCLTIYRFRIVQPNPTTQRATHQIPSSP